MRKIKFGIHAYMNFHLLKVYHKLIFTYYNIEKYLDPLNTYE